MSTGSENIKNIKRKIAKTGNTLPALELGKLPPQALDVEEAVLGALMLEKNAVNSIIDVLHGDVFYSEAHKLIFQAIHDLFHGAKPVDILTVTQHLKSEGTLEFVGGPYYIAQLTNRVASAANIEFHARIIIQKFIQRELIRISTDISREAYEDTSDVIELLNRAEKNLFAIAEGNLRKKYDGLQGLISKAIKEYEHAATMPEGLSGIPSGFTSLDRVTGGWQKSDLIIAAARPGMGKTAFVLSLARNAALRFNKPVAFFSCEMSSLQLVNRLIASETEISSEKLRKGNLSDAEWQQLNSKISPLEKAPIYIDDTPALTVFDLRAKCRRLVAEKKIELIIIDYLQLMQTGDTRAGNREQEISIISRTLKAIAKELDIPIICLSQLSREVEKRGGPKKPMLSDLRESGAIEQDADMVLFIYRPEYYDQTQDADGVNTQGLAEIIVAKNRNGSLQSVNLRFIGHLTKFTDFEFDYSDQSGLITQRHEPERMTRGSKINDDGPDF
ncbi:MAG: replicative DNA helicase [Bacteroidia bacterium]|nr:replicative DNA helicase [Bacteroidia bacterium]HQV00687.1 replicative DNA helicase [Bacteroidia bacterium]